MESVSSVQFDREILKAVSRSISASLRLWLFKFHVVLQLGMAKMASFNPNFQLPHLSDIHAAARMKEMKVGAGFRKISILQKLHYLHGENPRGRQNPNFHIRCACRLRQTAYNGGASLRMDDQVWRLCQTPRARIAKVFFTQENRRRTRRIADK